MDVSVNINVPLLRLNQNNLLMNRPNLLQVCREDDQIHRNLSTAASQLADWTQRITEERRDWSTGKQLFILLLVSGIDYTYWKHPDAFFNLRIMLCYSICFTEYYASGWRLKPIIFYTIIHLFWIIKPFSYVLQPLMKKATTVHCCHAQITCIKFQRPDL